MNAELREQAKLSVWWLSGSVFAIFLVCLVLDLGVIFIGPVVILATAIIALLLIWRGGRCAWRQRTKLGQSLIIVLIMPIAVGLFILSIRPAVGLGSWGQAWITLQLYWADYAKVIANSSSPNLATTRRLWLKTGGKGPGRLLVFGYGGFLSMERDIVYDPRDLPEQRALSLLSANVADCSHLQGHFYDCSLDF